MENDKLKNTGIMVSKYHNEHGEYIQTDPDPIRHTDATPNS